MKMINRNMKENIKETKPGCTGIWMSILCNWKGWAQDQVGVGGGRLQTEWQALTDYYCKRRDKRWGGGKKSVR